MSAQEMTQNHVTQAQELTEEARAPLPAPEDAAAVSDVTAAAEDAARAPLKTPEESHAEIEQAQAAMPHSAPHPHAQTEVMGTTFDVAEQTIATYLGQKLNPAFLAPREHNGIKEEFLLTLGNRDAGHGQTQVSFTIHSPYLRGNFAEIEREVMGALHSHPALKGNTTLTMNAADAAGDGNTAIITANVPAQEYTKFIQALAHPVKHHVTATHKEEAAETEAKAEPKAETHKEEINNAVEALAHPKPVEPTKPETQKDVVAELAQTPAAQVETPVMQLGRAAEVPELAIGA